ncbi:SAF domain-containing protein [Catenulispora sp. GAS73]|uniref:SAF domain-containing protein n=1 Tax=Catenulispora sp. GAS73 TaxID=3156269 RepID=UPI003514951A
MPRPGKRGAEAGFDAAEKRVAGSGRKRARPYLWAGAVLALGGAFAFAGAFSHLGGRVAVLQLAHPVRSGQVITVGDVRSVEVAADANVPLIRLADSGSVIGHPAALSLPAGTLLSRADLGSSTLPAGQAMVAVSVKAGAFPTELSAGQTVAVALVTPAGQGGSAGVPVVVPSLPTATVLSTTAASDSSGSMSVTLQAPAGAAGQIASIPAGQVQLIVLGSDTAGS